MKRSIILLVSSIVILGTSCDNYFDEHLMDNPNPPVIDIREDLPYELTDADYATIAKLPANIEKALAIDSAALLELQAIATNKYFTETAAPDMYIPAFLVDKYPYLDNGSFCNITYHAAAESSRLKEFNGAQGFDLVTDDYEAIWQKRGADYLTPSTVERIPDFLLTKMANANVGQIALITYVYSETEPDASELSDFLPYELTLSELLVFPDEKRHQISGYVGDVKSSISGRFYMVDGDYSIYVYGLTDEDGNKVWKDKGIQQGDAITIIGRYSTESGEPQILDGIYVSHTPASSAPKRVQKTGKKLANVKALYQLAEDGWHLYSCEDVKAADVLPQSVYEQIGINAITDLEVIHKYLTVTYPYAQKEEIYLVAYMGKNGATADEWIYDGSDFVYVERYANETMPFKLKKGQWLATTYLQSKFVGEGPGKFTIHNVSLDGLSFIWRYQALYGMTASAYTAGSNHRVEDWLISPAVRLKKAIKPQLTFDHAVRYGNTTDNPTWLNVMVTDNFTGDVTTTEWKKLEWQAELPDGSNWVFRSSGIFDLSDYNDKTIVIGFRYKTDFDGIDVPSAPTWEIQNLLLAEPDEDEAN